MIERFINPPTATMGIAEPTMHMRNPWDAMEHLHRGGDRIGAHVMRVNHGGIGRTGDQGGATPRGKQTPDPLPRQFKLTEAAWIGGKQLVVRSAYQRQERIEAVAVHGGGDAAEQRFGTANPLIVALQQ